jgi:L-asparaginase
MTIKIFTTGGTLDKVYFDANSEFQVGEPGIVELLIEANVAFAYTVESLMRKDSLDLTDADRSLIHDRVAADSADRILITHGTDTMVRTANLLTGIEHKTIVLTGAMQPARLRVSDAAFNVGAAVVAVQTLPAGVYVVMNGCVFDPRTAHKNQRQQRFETSAKPELETDATSEVE